MSRREYDSPRKPKKSRTFEINGRMGVIHLLESGAPRYELRIDAEGRWYHEGVEIIREDIRVLFGKSLIRRENGDYCIHMGDDEFPVVVEDAPFVVVRVTRKSEDKLALLLNDGATERLDPRTISFSENVPYCIVRNNIEARLSRPAYYQLAQFIECDEARRQYYILIGGERVYLDAHWKKE